jgi:ankyrin repeat protein
MVQHEACEKQCSALCEGASRDPERLASELTSAIIAHKAACVRQLLAAGADSNSCCDGERAVAVACEFGDEECLRALIEAGANVKIRSEQGKTLLLMVCERSDGAAPLMAGLLVAAGCDPDEPGEDGETPLIAAALGGNTDCVRVLVACGAALEKADAAGRTPLIRAAAHLHGPALEALLAAGADPLTCSSEGATALCAMMSLRGCSQMHRVRWPLVLRLQRAEREAALRLLLASSRREGEPLASLFARSRFFDPALWRVVRRFL